MQIEGKINNDLAIIALDGHLTHNTANEFRDVWDPITKMDEVSKVILDFEKVNFISSQGVGEIILLLKAMQNKNGQLKLCSTQDHVWDILKVLGLTAYLKRYSDINAAKKSFSK